MSLHLPEQFFCDSGIFYDSIFQHPPLALIRYAMQLIVKKTVVETSLQTLDLSQINIAIKQLKIDAFCGVNQIDRLTEEFQISSPAGEKEEKENSKSLPVSSMENILITSTLIELIRIYILSSIQKKTLILTLQKYNYPFSTSSASSDVLGDDHLYVFNHLNHSSTSSTIRSMQEAIEPKINFPFLEYYIGIPMKQIQEETLAKLKGEKEESKSSSPTSPASKILHSSTLSPEFEVEMVNNTLKPYLRQLTALKQLLAGHLKEVKESRAFMVFGLTANATEDMIKKAYRSLAIKYHPDKPGGNTAKFQQLQASYQEILNSIKQRKLTDESRMNEDDVAEIFQKIPKNKKNQQQRNPFSFTEDDTMEDTLASFMKSQTASEEKQKKQAKEEDTEEEEADEVKVDAPSPVPEKQKSKLWEDDDSDSSSSSSSSSGKENAHQNHTKDKKEKRDSKEKEEETSDVEVEDEPDEDDDIIDSIDEIIAKYTRNAFPEAEIETKNKNKSPNVSPSSKKAQPPVSNLQPNSSSNPQTSASASTSNRSTFIFPELPTNYETHEEHAMMIYHYIEGLLHTLQKYSHDFSIHLQYNLKWQKTIEKQLAFYSKEVDPIPGLVIGFHEFQKRFLPSTLLKRQQQQGGDKNKQKIEYPGYTESVDESIALIETICEIAQKITTVAMDITTECGIDYATTIRNDSDFTRSIEQTMKLAIMTLQFIVPFVSHSQSFSSTYRRISDSFSTAIESNSEEIANVLIQMMSLGLQNNSKFYMNIMDHIMKLMTSLHNCKEILYYLLQKTKEDALLQFKKKVERKSNIFSAFFSSMSGTGDDNLDDEIIDQMDYCDEDKEMLKQARRKEREEQTKRNNKDDKDGGESNDEEGNNKESNPFGNDDDGAEGGDVLNSLKNKIKLLQYQLQCQQINALKALNSDLITIQSQLMEEFQAVPLYSSFSDLLNDKLPSFRSSTRQLKSSQLLHGGAKDKAGSIQESVFSLIAECVDNSLFLFRNTIMTVDEFYLERVNLSRDFVDEDEDNYSEDDDENDMFDEFDDIYDFDLSNNNKKKKKRAKKEDRKKKLTFEEIISEKIRYYFAWLFCITFLNQENVQEMMINTCQQKNYSLLSSYLSVSSSSEDKSLEKESLEKVRIALLPDYRSKLLYFGSLVDMNQVISILQHELPTKLHDIIEEWNEARSQSTSSLY